MRALEHAKAQGSMVNPDMIPENVNVQDQSRQSPEQIQISSTKQAISMVSGKDVFNSMSNIL